MPVGSPLGSGGLFTPSAMAFGPDGNLCISGGTLGGNLGVRHDFGSGGEIGSVSAASSAFAANIGKQFNRVGNTLTIG